MTAILTLPRLGETMEEGRVVVWLVAPGEAFKRGDALLEVETDKTVVEVPALEDGVITEILAAEGAQIKVGDPIAKLDGEDATVVAPSVSPAPKVSEHPAPEARPEQSLATPTASPSEGIRATPLARRLARQRGIDISKVKGTGRRNRVERADVMRAVGAEQGVGGTLPAHSIAGPQNGEPVVLLHGFGGDRTIWAGTTAGLTRTGKHVLSVDLPGHGETAIEAKSPDDLTEGLANLLTQTFDGPAHIVAHSMGAVPAIALAQAGLAKSLNLIAPIGLGLHIDADFVVGLSKASTGGEVAHLLQRTMEQPLPLSDDALAQIANDMRRGRLAYLAASLTGPAGQTLSVRAILAQLADTLPVRIIAPGRDRIVDSVDMVTVSHRIAVHHLPRAGHLVMWDAPKELLEILSDATAD